MKSMIITGATGMIGSAIISEALKLNYLITAIIRRSSARASSLPSDGRLKIIECNIDEYDSLKQSLQADVFIHLAWDKTFGNSRDDVDVQLSNVKYTLDAVRLAKRCGCSVFIGAGSQAEYGVQEVDLEPSLPVQPESGYGIAKYAAGKLSAMLCKQFGIRFNWLRILSVYGKNDAPHTLISYVINELKNGRSPELTECNQDWDYLNSIDAARAFLAVAKNGVDGKFYPLGSGFGRKLRNFIEDIKSVVNPNVSLGFGLKPYYPHQPMHLVADVSELTADTGWKPEISFIDGIRSLVDY
ncbi:MAG: NAD(P)-dependent oxidoreductase [Treponema sp.]|nr:NAD(P)-dependent oxidoreductase [Treponema sp.]